MPLGSHSSPLPPKKVEPDEEDASYLVGYFADGMHIATVRQQGSSITIHNLLSDTPQQLISTGMKIQDIKVIGNTIFAVDNYKFVSWDLEAGEIAYPSSGTRRVTIDEALSIVPHAEHLTLSNNCSQIAFAVDTTLYLYNIGTQKSICQEIGRRARGIKFSIDGRKLWPIRVPDIFYLKGLEMVWDWSSGEVTKVSPEDRELLFDPPSPYGYYIGIDSEWVENSRGGKLLWLPPNWRICDLQNRRWDGDFLAIVGYHYSQPIIVKFQSQAVLLDP